MMEDTRILQTDWDGPVFVVLPVGDVGAFAGEQVSLEVDDVLAELDEMAAKRVLVDFVEVEYFGSSLLAAVQRIWKHVTGRGDKLAICNVPVLGREVLKVSRFEQLWDVYDTRPAAREALLQ
jgi:anti-anti-sigma regulatory factor